MGREIRGGAVSKGEGKETIAIFQGRDGLQWC